MRKPLYKLIVPAMLVGPSVATVVAVTQWGRFSSPPACVEIRRLEPSGDAIVEVECASLGFVNFKFQVFNRGEFPLMGLKLGTKCGCEQVQDLPREIPAGGSAPVGFRIRAPFAGKSERKVPLLADGASEPVAVFDASLRVKFQPPGLVPPPDGLSLTFVEGDTASRELVFEAIEAKREKPWICGLDHSVQDQLECGPLRVEEFPEMDPDLTRRRYCFPLANRSLPLGQRMATVTFKTSGRAPRPAESAVVWCNVVDRVAIVPNPLVIKRSADAEPASRRVRVVNRRGDQAVATPIEFDGNLLQVSSAAEQHGSTAVFEITPAQNDPSATETQVVFNVGGSDTRELVVRFEPSPRR